MTTTVAPSNEMSPRSPRVSPPSRLHSVDILRGLIMIIMALDHARDIFYRGSALGDPELLADPGAALFFTRWITHFCAPLFVFLAGTGAFLSLGRGRTRKELSWFLVTRGFWLIVLEFTLVKFGWIFSFTMQFNIAQVIFALGVSMIVLAALIWLPMWAIVAFGALMVLGHNALDGLVVGTGDPNAFGPGSGPIPVGQLGFWNTLWAFLHVPNLLQLPNGWLLLVRYPLIPWIGVMALGYTLGPLLQRPDEERRRTLLRLGLALTAAFILLRLANIYGDPRAWSVRGDVMDTIIAFLNTQKYPPSLLFLLMTLGPGIALLPLLERWTGPVANFVEIFGRVPLFFYLLYVPLLRVIASVIAIVMLGPDAVRPGQLGPPPGFGFDLPVVYLIWVVAIALLYLPCKWFAGLKARRRDWKWLSYL